MARVFLDTNIFIDYVERKPSADRAELVSHKVFVSVLSVHILAYIYKYKVPTPKLKDLEKNFTLLPFNRIIFEKSRLGPTTDFEDNVQLNSAVEADCDFFLTLDRQLLKLKFFGKTRVVSSLSAD
ncbi:MAG: PIN domain-containing protein [Candidatus Blackburnbacteria bacterium]|nr:PIN domain-containing protein [Candidatus Blackburnbacteria bacterium]